MGCMSATEWFEWEFARRCVTWPVELCLYRILSRIPTLANGYLFVKARHARNAQEFSDSYAKCEAEQIETHLQLARRVSVNISRSCHIHAHVTVTLHNSTLRTAETSLQRLLIHSFRRNHGDTMLRVQHVLCITHTQCATADTTQTTLLIIPLWQSVEQSVLFALLMRQQLWDNSM